MVSRVLSPASWKRRFLFAMLYALNIPANPLASDVVLENTLAARMVQLGALDPEMPDTLYHIGALILTARGLDPVDIQIWGQAAIKGGASDSTTQYSTINELANEDGLEDLGNNLNDIATKFGALDIIGGIGEIGDTIGDLLTGFFGGGAPP